MHVCVCMCILIHHAYSSRLILLGTYMATYSILGFEYNIEFKFTYVADKLMSMGHLAISHVYLHAMAICIYV